MYRTLLIIVIICFPFLSHAQNGYWAWANTAPDMGTAEAKKITTDKDGNVLVTGSFEGSITFGANTFTSAGSADVFTAKYDASGQLVWAQVMGGVAEDNGISIGADAPGNVYVTGNFKDTLYTGSSAVSSLGANDIFIAKYSSVGVLLWLKTGGSVNGDYVADIEIDQQDNIYLTGVFGISGGSPAPTTIFAAFANDTLWANNGSEIYLIKYDANGDMIWGKAIGGVGNSEDANSISLDRTGNIYLSGSFAVAIEFGNVLLTSKAVGFVVSDIFIAKFDNTGKALWAQGVGGYNSAGSSGGAIPFCSADINQDGDVYITGAYLNCDMVFPSVTLPSKGSYGTYLAKYDASGAFLWANNPEFGYYGILKGIATNTDGEVFLVGSFDIKGRIGKDSLVSAGFGDVFISKYDRDGNDLAGVLAGGSNYDFTNCIVTGSKGELYIAGGFKSDNATFGSHSVTSSNGQNMFVAKYQSYPTGINYTEASSPHINIYPNPVQNQLVIEGAAYGTEVQILNVLGQQVHNGSIISSNTTINTSALQPGMYIIHLTDNAGKTITRRVVKE